MIKVLGYMPKKVLIAVSGGADSMAALNFISNNGRREVGALYFDHGTDHGREAKSLVVKYCKHLKIPLFTGSISRDKNNDESQEEYWRNERYSFFSGFSSNIITCHHLDDVVETWLFTSFHGRGMLIPYKRDNFIRPFLCTRKDDLVSWCKRKDVPYIEDPSNSDTKYMRNLIRQSIVPRVLKVNPGIHKTVKKKVLEDYELKWATH